MYFKIFKPISWGKRPAERRRRFIQRFLRFALVANPAFTASPSKPKGAIIAATSMTIVSLYRTAEDEDLRSNDSCSVASHSLS